MLGGRGREAAGGGAGGFHEGSGAGAAYLFDGATGTLLLTLYSPHPVAGGRFGTSVAVVNGNLLVGAPYDAPLGQPYGAAYLFDGTSGAPLQTFSYNDPQGLGGFGTKVAGVGSNVLVNLPRSVSTGGLVFLFNGATGALIHQFSMDVGAAYFGRTIAGWGDDVLIGDWQSVFMFSGPSWGLTRTYAATANGGIYVLAPDGSQLFTGHPYYAADTTPAIGAISVFDSATGGLLNTYISPVPARQENFGIALAPFTDFVAVGATGGTIPVPFDGFLEPRPGIVYLIETATGNMLQDLHSPNPEFGGLFGCALAAAGDNLWIGASAEVAGTTVRAGRVYRFGPVGHTLAVMPQAVPSTVESGGSVFLPTDYIDSQNHGGLVWSWTDHGAGGTFLPSASDRNPTYVAPLNTSPNPRVITLTVTGTCEWYWPWISASADVLVTVEGTGGAHTLSVTSAVTPTTTPSGGRASLSASYVDSENHTGLAWSWSDHGAGGTFLPSDSVPNPTYVAPLNTSPNPRQITLTVTGICEWYWPWVTASADVLLTVEGTSSGHTLSVTNSVTPSTTSPGGQVSLSASYEDSENHTGLAWSWSDHGGEGPSCPPPRCRTRATSPPPTRKPSPLA